MHILAINRVGFIGGVERILLGIGVATREHGFATTLACPPGELAAAALNHGLAVQVVGIDRSKRTASPVGLLRIVRARAQGRRDITALAQRCGATLLHAHHPVGALYASQAARSLRLPLVLHVHETLPVRGLYAFALRQAIPFCSKFVCVSEASMALMRHMGVPPAALRLVYNGVDRSFLQPPRPVPDLDLPGPHVGLFGVLEPRKGQADFMKAAARVVQDHPTARFWLVGPLSFAENQHYVDGLREAANQAGLSGRVHFTGYRDDVRDWMARMDVVVLASREKESLPTALIEAATLGRALVATDVGGVREIIRDGQDGLVVPPRDPALLAAAISRALGPLGPAMAARAGSRAAERFGPERFGNAMAALYRGLLPSGLRAAA